MNIKRKRLKYSELVAMEMKLDDNERLIEMELRANLGKYKGIDTPLPCFEEEVPVKLQCYGKRKNYSQCKQNYERLIDRCLIKKNIKNNIEF